MDDNLLLNEIADVLWGEGPNTPWDSDTLDRIADRVMSYRADLYEARKSREVGVYPDLDDLGWDDHPSLTPEQRN